MYKLESYKGINIYVLVAIFTAITIGNILLISDSKGSIITMAQYIIVLYNLCKGKVHIAALLHFTFMLLSLSAQGTLGMFEASQFSMYNYGAMKLLGPIRASYLMNILLFSIVFLNPKYKINKELLLYKFFRVLLYLGLSAIIIGGIGIVVHPYYRFNTFLDNSIYMFVVLTSAYIMLSLANESFIKSAYALCLSSIIASIIGCFICYVFFGVTSHYSVLDIAYLSDIVSIGGPALIVGIVFIRHRLLAVISLLLFAYLMSITFGGKSFFALGFAVLALVYLLFFDKNTHHTLNKSIHSIRVVVIVLVLLLSVFLIRHITSDSMAFYKVMSALSIFSGDLGSVDRSPYIRIASVINIFYEGLSNPFTLLFGNGYGGYFEDKLNLFAGIDLSVGAWSDDIIRTGRFPSGHDSIVTIPLFNGLIGIYLMIKMGWLYLKRIPKNYLNSVIFFWFILKFYFNTIFAVIGIFCLLAAELDLSKENSKGVVVNS